MNHPRRTVPVAPGRRRARPAGVRRARRAHRVRRPAYTLLEVCVVVCLVVIITAITIPSIRNMMLDARLTAAGDQIRARMADARSMAMEQGVAVRFGYLPGTGKFQIAPDDDPAWDSVQDGVADQDTLLRDQLPEGVIFVTDGSSLQGGSPPSQGNTWQVGGVFLPEGSARGANNNDGTTSDDVTFYFGRVGVAPTGIRVHGMTGSVRLFDPSTEGNSP